MSRQDNQEERLSGRADSARDLTYYVLAWEGLQISQRFRSSAKVVLTESLETS